MPSIRYASLDEYWPAVRARAFAAEVRSLGGGPGFTTPRRLTYAKNMEILAEWAKVPVKHMPWVNPIAYAERLCSAAFSDPAYLTKIMGKSTYPKMLYSHTNRSTNILPEPRPAPQAPEPPARASAEEIASYLALFDAFPLPAPNPNSRRLEDRLGVPGVNMGRPLFDEPKEEPVPPAVRIERAENKAAALERQYEACEAMWMSAMARAEEAEEQVRQLKKEVAQVYLADLIAREATQRAAKYERMFQTLSAAVKTVLRGHDDVYWTKVWNEFEDTLA